MPIRPDCPVTPTRNLGPRVLGVPVEVVAYARLAEGEHSLQLAPSNGRAEPADRSERQGEIDRVDQAGGVPVGLDRVDVHPAREGAFDELVGERPASLVVDVPCSQLLPEWPHGHFQHHLRARLGDASGCLHDADVLPRRQQPLDRALAAVPVEGRRRAVAHRLLPTVDHDHIVHCLSSFCIVTVMSSVATYPVPTTPLPAGAAGALDVLAAGEILPAVAAAELLRRRAAMDRRVAGGLLDLLADGDRLAAMLSLHALSAAPGRAAELALVTALDEPDLGEHAAWALARRAPVLAAIPALAGLVAESRDAGGCSTAASAPSDPSWPVARSRCRSRPGAATGGLRIGRSRGRVDAELGAAGSGDGGGVVTLLVQLARELGRREDVARSLIVARARDEQQAADEPLGPGAAITRLPFGPTESVPVSAMWEYRVQIEQAFASVLAASGPIDVAHLRYADAGTFAAARALRRAGVRIVFTLAPDPHALIAEEERLGRLTRDSFAKAESAQHNLFRLRLIDDLTSRADQVVTLPRAGGRAALEQLVGRPLDPRRTVTIPEGISLDPLRQALDAASSPGPEPPSIAVDLGEALAGLGSRRLGLPLILSVAASIRSRASPGSSKHGAATRSSSTAFNLVLVGGDLERPSADEQAVIAEIDDVASRQPAARARPRPSGRATSRGRRASARDRAPRPVTTRSAPARRVRVRERKGGVRRRHPRGAGQRAPRRRAEGGGPDSYLENERHRCPRRARLRRRPPRRPPPGSPPGRRPRTGSGDAETLIRERFAIEPMASRPDRDLPTSRLAPMIALLVSPDYASHYLPLSAIGQALQARGAEVVVATGAGLEARVAADGFEHRLLTLGPGSNAGLIRPEDQPTEEASQLADFFAATRRGPVATLRHQAEQRLHDLLWQPDTVTERLATIIDELDPDARPLRPDRLRGVARPSRARATLCLAARRPSDGPPGPWRAVRPPALLPAHARRRPGRPRDTPRALRSGRGAVLCRVQALPSWPQPACAGAGRSVRGELALAHAHQLPGGARPAPPRCARRDLRRSLRAP